MKVSQTITACVCAAALVAATGCKDNGEMAPPPGPGPTALPQNSGSSGGMPGVGGINSESHMGSEHPMQMPSTQP